MNCIIRVGVKRDRRRTKEDLLTSLDKLELFFAGREGIGARGVGPVVFYWLWMTLTSVRRYKLLREPN
jgi:hypothetical protein